MSPRAVSLIHFANGTSVWCALAAGGDLNVMGPQRAETAPISVARQGPLTCPVATFAVAICNGSKTSTPAVPFAQIAAIPIGVANGRNRPKCPLQRIQLCFVLKSAAVMDAGERAKCSAEATRRLCHGQS